MLYYMPFRCLVENMEMCYLFKNKLKVLRYIVKHVQMTLKASLFPHKLPFWENASEHFLARMNNSFSLSARSL